MGKKTRFVGNVSAWRFILILVHRVLNLMDAPEAWVKSLVKFSYKSCSKIAKNGFLPTDPALTGYYLISRTQGSVGKKALGGKIAPKTHASPQNATRQPSQAQNSVTLAVVYPLTNNGSPRRNLQARGYVVTQSPRPTEPPCRPTFFKLFGAFLTCVSLYEFVVLHGYDLHVWRMPFFGYTRRRVELLPASSTQHCTRLCAREFCCCFFCMLNIFNIC